MKVLKKLKCIGGPLSGFSMPDFGTRFFQFIAYETNGSQGPVHVYRQVGGEWVTDDDGTTMANETDASKEGD